MVDGVWYDVSKKRFGRFVNSMKFETYALSLRLCHLSFYVFVHTNLCSFAHSFAPSLCIAQWEWNGVEFALLWLCQCVSSFCVVVVDFFSYSIALANIQLYRGDDDNEQQQQQQREKNTQQPSTWSKSSQHGFFLWNALILFWDDECNKQVTFFSLFAFDPINYATKDMSSAICLIINMNDRYNMRSSNGDCSRCGSDI